MSIHTRVISATLGLAVVGFVVTLGAQDDKILIVRDGSVDVYVNRSSFERKKGDEHKWSKKADVVQVFEETVREGRQATPPCTSRVGEVEDFKRVVLKVRDLTNNRDVDITARTGGVPPFRFLKLEMPPRSQWEFAFREFRRKLVDGKQEPNLKLQQVVVTGKDSKDQTFPSQPSTTGLVCVHFIDR